MKTVLDEVKGIFVKPKKRYYLGSSDSGYMYRRPRKFNPTILSVSKNKLKYDQNYFDVFGYRIKFGYPIWLTKRDLGWKDKFNSPRYEFSPLFSIFFFKWQFSIVWDAPDGDNDKYYEMILHYLYYSDKDIKKSKSSWGWVDSETKQSTWDDDYILLNTSRNRDKLIDSILK